MHDMSSITKPKRLTTARLVGLAIFSIIGGFVGYLVGGYVGDLYPREEFDALLARSGVSFLTHLALGSFGLMYFFIGGLTLLAHVNPDIDRLSGYSQFIGSSKKGRKAVFPLALFYFAYGILMSILAVQTLWTPTGGYQAVVLCLAVASALVMLITSWQLWLLLDELVRAIWLESCAASSLLILVAVMVWQVLLTAGFKIEMSALAWIAIYNAVYLVIYLAITALRAPQMLTPLEEEG
jgi:hypothetical protein